jgi:hypothetical protein
MIKKIIITLSTLLISFVLLNSLLGEVAVYYEKWSTGAQSRAELANDFGLGL